MKFKRFMALALAGVMTLGMASSVVAADGVQEKVTIKKTVTMADGITTLDTDTATFLVHQIANKDGIAAPASVSDLTPSITGINATNKGGEKEIDFSSVTIPGEYTFELTETAPADKGNAEYGWTKDRSKYYIQVLVKNNNSKEFYITKDGETTKKNSADFTNTYTKKAPDLTVTKKVSGEYADLNQAFEFTVKFTGSTTATVPDSGFPYKIGNGAEQNLTSGGKIYLKNGETATFTNIPAGIKVEVNETKVENYEKPELVIQDANGTRSVENYSTGNILLGDVANKIEFTNNYKPITPTGLAISVAPFVAMFAAVGAAIALYVAAKRRVR